MSEHLERASTGRARCKICKEPIEKGALRLGTSADSASFDGAMTAWHHAICAAMRRPTGYLRAAQAYEGTIDPVERDQLEAIANMTRANKLKSVVWRHATAPRCLLELAQDRYVLFTTVKGQSIVVRGTLEETIASVPDEDLETVVDTATASGHQLGRAAAKPAVAKPSGKLRRRYEAIAGARTFVYELALDEAKCQVTTSMESGATGTKLAPYGKPTKRKLDTPELARKYFRYRSAKLADIAELVAGDKLELDPEEDFKDVKDKSPDYRLLENASTKQFWDIDRDSSILTVWEGAIGTKGTATTLEHDWDGDAKARYKELLDQKLAAGYVEPPGLAGKRAAGRR